MGTVNISLPDAMIKKVDYVAKANNYSSRSEVIRNALRDFFFELDQARTTGTALAAITMTFNLTRRGTSEEINQLQHKFEDIILTTIHNHIGKKCLEIILTKGEFVRVNELVKQMKNMKGVELVKMTVAENY